MAKRKKKIVRKGVVHLKQINFTLREYAAIQIFSRNWLSGISINEAINQATELQSKLKQIRKPLV